MQKPLSKKGFTLIELLIVVAIIAILAAIAVPNFLEAQTRAKVSRVKSDIRALVTATETYTVDHGKYPLPSDDKGNAMLNPLTDPTDWFETKIPVSITTPIAYITSRLGDVFANPHSLESRLLHYTSLSYFNIRQNNAPTANWNVIYKRYYKQLKGVEPPSVIQYFFLSFGPDKAHNIDAPHSGPSDEPHVHRDGAIYDPTNGTLSTGDIHYMGPGIGFL